MTLFIRVFLTLIAQLTAFKDLLFEKRQSCELTKLFFLYCHIAFAVLYIIFVEIQLLRDTVGHSHDLPEHGNRLSTLKSFSCKADLVWDLKFSNTKQFAEVIETTSDTNN